jgi:hypothetical protein
MSNRPLAKLTWLWKAIDWLGEATTIKPEWVKPALTLSLFHSDQPNTTDYKPKPNIHAVLLGHPIVDTTRWAEDPEIAYTQGIGGGGLLNSRIKILMFAMPKFLTHGDSLYYNAPVFIRISFPFFIGVHVRWSGSETKSAFFQTHVGWKPNGRLALALRVQSDPSAERGMDFPNPGQARGWEYAGK